MKYTDQEIIKRVTENLDMCLESANAELYDYSDRVIELDRENGTIIIKLDFHIVEEDDYIGLGSY